MASVWKYLIGASSSDILKLPLYDEGWTDRIQLEGLGVEYGAANLIGFWLNRGTTAPARTLGSWSRAMPDQYWGRAVRSRIANQVELIKHWRVFEGTYSRCPDVEATWFIDPPYQLAGSLYRFNNAGIDYTALAKFCTGRRGQTLVCEGEGADWLPFDSFIDMQYQSRKSGKELLWVNK